MRSKLSVIGLMVFVAGCAGPASSVEDSSVTLGDKGGNQDPVPVEQEHRVAAHDRDLGRRDGDGKAIVFIEDAGVFEENRERVAGESRDETFRAKSPSRAVGASDKVGTKRGEGVATGRVDADSRRTSRGGTGAAVSPPSPTSTKDDAEAVAVPEDGLGVAAAGLRYESWPELQGEWENLGPVYTEPGHLPHLEVAFLSESDRQRHQELLEGGRLRVPLEHTHVDVKISGPVARVEVQQRYKNPFANVIEAVYVFPLPENAAVDGMRMHIGDRVIRGVIKERAVAQAMYQEAKAAGKVAALLEQERPNIFTQSVANIAPQTEIRIDVQYVQDLSYDNGDYEFVFPMVVGPRYVPSSGPSRTRPPVLGQGTRSGHDISLSLVADAGVPILSHQALTHDIESQVDGSGKVSLRLAEHETLPNRDFVWRYRVAAPETQAAVLSEMKGKEGFFTLIIQPPDRDVNALVGTREMVFVIDVSGSMRGVPLQLCQEALADALRRLRPVDTFNIVTFASGSTRLFDEAMPANQHYLAQAMDFVENMRGGGGTNLMAAVMEAVNAPIDANVSRVIVFMTDGFIGNEAEVLQSLADGVAAIEKQHARARVFAFGVGSSVNRYLIDELAKIGQGTNFYANNREDPSKAVDAFFQIVDYPIWSQVELDFGALEVERVYPARLPDLMVTRPIVVHGRFKRAGSGQVTLRARAQGQTVELPVQVSLAKGQEHGGVLGTLWARSAVESLERDMFYVSSYEQDKLRNEITRLGMDHGIVTHYTSFVAVDHSTIIEGGGDTTQVVQPIHQPEGVGRE